MKHPQRGRLCHVSPLLRAHDSYMLLPILSLRSLCVREFFRILLPKESIPHLFQINAVPSLQTRAQPASCCRAEERQALHRVSAPERAGRTSTGSTCASSAVLKGWEASIL